VPTVVTVHGGDLTRPWLWLHPDPAARARALRDCLGRATRVTAVSQFSKRQAEAAGAAHVIVIPNGVDPDRFRPGDRGLARRRLRLPAERPILLSVSRLVPRKGHRDALAALPRLAAWNPLYLIAGSGITHDEIADRVRAANLGDQVKLLGDVDPDGLVALYQAADIFVLSGHQRCDEQGLTVEGFGIVFLEAAACARPCVATRIGGVADAVADGRTGLLVPQNDPESLAGALAELLRDPDRAAELGREGRRRVEARFTLAHLARRFEAIYRDATRSRRGVFSS
jgi:phosphatidylinositol alpha-1,6-mannosyltransferase